MAVELTERVQEIARERGLDESEVLEQALERGVEDLWRDVVIERYLDGELTRTEAIDAVGRETIQRVDREVDAVERDVKWGRQA